MTTGAVLLAFPPDLTASACDPLAPLGSCSALQRLVRTLQNSGIRQILLLVPPEKHNLVEKHMARWGALCMPLQSASSPLGSLQQGLSALQHRCDRILFLAANVPFLSVKTVHALLASPAPLCYPAHQDEAGGVLCVSAPLFPSLLQLDASLPLTALPEQCGVPFTAVPVSDEGVLPDAQQRGLYPALLARSRAETVSITLKLRLCRERPFFGPGTVQLLSLIETTQSVREACAQMGLSYSKGRKMISVMEDELGIPIVLRQQGGKHGGTATLTAQGRQLITQFQQFESRCQELVQQAYDEIFS